MVEKKRTVRAARPARGGRQKAKVRAANGPAVQFDVPALDTLDLASSMDRVAKILARSVGEVARKYDATAGQMFIVAALCRAPAGLTAKHLASALAIRPGSLTGMLDTLEKRGVVRRERVPGDARQQRLVLLENARPLVDALSEVDAMVAGTLVGLDKDRLAGLHTLSQQTEAALRAETALLASAAPVEEAPATVEETPATVEETPATVDAPAAKKTAAEKAEKAEKAEQPTTEPARPYYPPPPVRPQPDNRMPPPQRAEDPGLRRNLFSLTTRVLNAVDAQVRKRRDS